MSTLTLIRNLDEFISVSVVVTDSAAFVDTAVDENGAEVSLTVTETAEVVDRALNGEDETGI